MDDREERITSDPVLEVYKRDIDQTLIRENLKLSHEERLLKLIEHRLFADELRQAGRRVRGDGK